MAAITSAVVGGVGAIGSAAASIKGAKQQQRQADAANRRLQDAALRAFSFQGPGGLSGSFDPSSGRLFTSLGDRLGGQQGLFDQLAQGFLGRDSSGELDPARALLGQQAGVAGAQPQTSDFSGLLGLIGGNINQAQSSLGQALGFGQQTRGLGDLAFGQAGQFLGDIGTGEQARDRQLNLLRQQAAPFEERAFTRLQDNLFATGRLGTTGGALQTEAFARGLGQADLGRQLAATQEGRAAQNQALGLAQGSFGLGAGQRGLADDLLGSAFGRFSDISRLGTDVERARFGQQFDVQNNLFNQLGSMFTQQLGLAGTGRDFQQSDLQNALQLFAQGNALQSAPLDFLRFAQQSELARSNAALGSGTALSGVQTGQQADAMASLLGGLGQAGRSGALEGFLGSLGDIFGKPSAPRGGSTPNMGRSGGT